MTEIAPPPPERRLQPQLSQRTWDNAIVAIMGQRKQRIDDLNEQAGLTIMPNIPPDRTLRTSVATLSREIAILEEIQRGSVVYRPGITASDRFNYEVRGTFRFRDGDRDFDLGLMSLIKWRDTNKGDQYQGKKQIPGESPEDIKRGTDIEPEEAVAFDERYGPLLSAVYQHGHDHPAPAEE